jgi:hypothetical protein
VVLLNHLHVRCEAKGCQSESEWWQPLKPFMED